jgi:hypothetical protein
MHREEIRYTTTSQTDDTARSHNDHTDECSHEKSNGSSKRCFVTSAAWVLFVATLAVSIFLICVIRIRLMPDANQIGYAWLIFAAVIYLPWLSFTAGMTSAFSTMSNFNLPTPRVQNLCTPAALMNFALGLLLCSISFWILLIVSRIQEEFTSYAAGLSMAFGSIFSVVGQAILLVSVHPPIAAAVVSNRVSRNTP